MDLAQYDKWVIGNQKRILDWTKMHSKERFAPIRDAFTAYHRAKSNKQKIQAFENLKKELVSGKGVKYNDLVNNTFEPTREYLQGAADKFTKGDIDALDRNSNLSDKLRVYDDLAPLSEAMKSIPEKVKGFDWVELDKAFRDNYSYDEMKALADKYNFDYKDPKERKEFIELLADMEHKRLKQDAYTPKDARGMLLQLAYPVTLEHARKTDEFSPGAMAFDLASQAAMAGGAGYAAEKLGGGMLAQEGANLATAPIITEAGQKIVNKKEAGDAIADAAVGIGTNMLAPGIIQGYGATFTRPLSNTPKAGVKATANKIANEAESVIRAKNNGVPYRNIPDLSKEAEALLQKKLDRDYYNFHSNLKAQNPNIPNELVYSMWQKELGSKIVKYSEEAKNDAAKIYMQNQELKIATGKGTGVYKKDWRGKTVELTPNQVNKSENNIMNITPEDRAKEQIFYKWKRENNPIVKENAQRDLASKILRGEQYTAEDIVNAGYQENPLHMLYRRAGRLSDPAKSLLSNLGVTTRAMDKKTGSLGRNFNLPWNYGDSEKELDLEDPRIKTYLQAYGRYKGNENYFAEPPKPKNLSDDDIRKLQELATTIKIMDIFGE